MTLFHCDFDSPKSSSSTKGMRSNEVIYQRIREAIDNYVSVIGNAKNSKRFADMNEELRALPEDVKWYPRTLDITANFVRGMTVRVDYLSKKGLLAMADKGVGEKTVDRILDLIKYEGKVKWRRYGNTFQTYADGTHNGRRKHS